ncbi:hypothetical protein Salmi_Mp012 (mitochondrion) [Salvia miltiorrhiza]|uniref:Uncharacterized protein n=1 Tax=Salvia miltiorrhiza TaxID=226208 RepID=V9P5J4_SALMI|nr:hypothetical protein Salmi_Mp012 [Salvia miltiorrhiza]AGU16547.1 hypothetical protein Salmi_Mp012 [Salvia miltiorrhiza]
MRRNLILPIPGSVGSTSSSPSEILQGIPIQNLGIEESDAVSSPFYFAGVVHIPGEIENPLTVEKLTQLNHFLVNVRRDFANNIIQSSYTKFLQCELDQTPAELLSAKLDFMLNREYAHLYHYFQTLGTHNPLDLCRQYENWCHYWYLQTLSAPSPLDPFSTDPVLYAMLFSISIIAAMFWLKNRKNKKPPLC